MLLHSACIVLSVTLWTQWSVVLGYVRLRHAQVCCCGHFTFNTLTLKVTLWHGWLFALWADAWISLDFTVHKNQNSKKFKSIIRSFRLTTMFADIIDPFTVLTICIHMLAMTSNEQALNTKLNSRGTWQESQLFQCDRCYTSKPDRVNWFRWMSPWLLVVT